MKHTQKQLEAMSDYELDGIIFESIYGTLGSDKDMLRVWHSGKVSYCNSWADMGPLLRDNKISIDYYGGDDPSACAWMPYGFIGSSSSTELRAAAIVYILIKQGDKNAMCN